jgi:hypothetical protein
MQDESLLQGRWELISVGDYEPGELNAETDAFIEFSAGDQGAFHFAYVRGSMEYRAADRDTEPAIEFSFDGHDGAAPLCGTGWVILKGEQLEGTFSLHTGEELPFEAMRANQSHHCPACGRDFENVLDFPRVRIRSFERLPIPEAVDTMSGAALDKKSIRRMRENAAEVDLSADGINVTPAIERACSTAEIQQYFGCLAQLVGNVVESRQLLPPLKPHGRFKWAYPVGDTGILVSLSDAVDTGRDQRVADVRVHCAGPNLGSAGGPTLQLLGSIARLEYDGLLNEGFA